MGNEKINWRDEAYTLPLADLKRIYEKKKNARTLTTSIPFMIALMILFAANYLVIFGQVVNGVISAQEWKMHFSIAGAWDVPSDCLCCGAYCI